MDLPVGAECWYLDGEDIPHRGTIISETVFDGIGAVYLVEHPTEQIYVPKKRAFKTRKEALEAQKNELTKLRKKQQRFIERIDQRLEKIELYLVAGELRNVDKKNVD